MLELEIYGDIGEAPWWSDEPGITAKSVSQWLRENANGARELLVKINSYGGWVSEGVAIRNLLEQHPARVTTEVVGFALSAGSVIAMAGKTIRMLPGTMMMIHPAAGWCQGTAKDMESTANALNSMTDASAAIYAERTGNSKEKCLELMNAETWMSPSEAKALGFCDEAPTVIEKRAAREPSTNLAGSFLQAYQRMPDSVRASMQARLPRQEAPVQPKAAPVQSARPQLMTVASTPLGELARGGRSARIGD